MLLFIPVEENKSTPPHCSEQCRCVQSWYPRGIGRSEKMAIKDDTEISCITRHCMFKCKELGIILRVVISG